MLGCQAIAHPDGGIEVRKVRKLDPGPTWLAFAVWAHPNGRLILGSDPPLRPAPFDDALACDFTDASGVTQRFG
ncbi:MAG: hypothetical protein GY856_13490 [bacterium]|nr:hypothetical protein [bacterium]